MASLYINKHVIILVLHGNLE